MISDTRDLAYDLAFEACGETWRARRTFELLRRIEDAFGAIDPLSRRLEMAAVTQRELLVLYDLLLDAAKEHGQRPTRGDVQAWLFEIGTHRPAKRLAGEVLSLVMGTDRLAQVIELKGATARGKEPGTGEGERPFEPTAASTGATGSKRARASA